MYSLIPYLPPMGQNLKLLAPSPELAGGGQ